MARDLATRFSKAYGETFVVPRAVTAPVAARVMDLQDPAGKMSKSAAPAAPGVLRLLDPPSVIRHKVARAVTDSGRDVIFDPVGKPGVANLLTILAACTGITPIKGPGSGHMSRPGPPHWERVTGIEPALSAWESDRSRPIRPLSSRLRRPSVAVSAPS